MGLVKGYLVAYNAVSCALWATIFVKTALLTAQLPLDRLHETYHDIMWPLLVGTQTLAVVEILHAAAGLVRASPATTALQVVGKNLVVWTVMIAFPELVIGSDGQGFKGVWPFLGCVIPWSLSEIIKYGYFAIFLTTGDAPAWLKWLRYSAFIPLYPVGMFSEAWLVYLALTETYDVSMPYMAYLFAGLLTYLPAGPHLYTHMLKQRRRALRGESEKKAK